MKKKTGKRIQNASCIRDGCGKQFDKSIPETRDPNTLRPFWQRYCPEHRVTGETYEPIVEIPAKPARKRILSVRVKRMVDDSPDTSWLGEYSNRPTSEFSIDRAHSSDCQSQQHPRFVITPVETHRLHELFDGPDKENHCKWCDRKRAKCETEYCEHADKHLIEWRKWEGEAVELLQRIENRINDFEIDAEPGTDVIGTDDAQTMADSIETLESLARDLTECDCGERGDMRRSEYRYFNPSFNYVDKHGHALPENTPEEVRKYVRQDYERMEDLHRGDWCFIGIRAEAEVMPNTVLDTPDGKKWHGVVQRVTSGGLWGIESDSGESYFSEVEQEELSNLKDELKAYGFNTRAISKAFQNVQHKSD